MCFSCGPFVYIPCKCKRLRIEILKRIYRFEGSCLLLRLSTADSWQGELWKETSVSDIVNSFVCVRSKIYGWGRRGSTTKLDSGGKDYINRYRCRAAARVGGGAFCIQQLRGIPFSGLAFAFTPASSHHRNETVCCTNTGTNRCKLDCNSRKRKCKRAFLALRIGRGMMSSKNIPADKINLRLILVSGKTKEFLFSPSDSAGDIALTVFENWPDDWESEAVAKAEILRLIYQGRFLHCNVTLGALGLPLGKTTVMHLVPRDNLPEPNSQDQRQKSKGGSSRCCSTSCCIL